MAICCGSAESCQAAAQFGWFIGVTTGGIADVLFVGLVASAPKLGTRRLHAGRLRKKTRFWLQRSLWALALVWLWGGFHARTFLFCYTVMLALGCAITTGIVILLALLTAANQIGARSVR